MSSGDNVQKPIVSEPFEEPSVMSNVVEYFSNYINVKKVDEINNDKIISWAKFINCHSNDSGYNSNKGTVNFLIGRPQGIHVYQLKTNGNLTLIYSLEIDSSLTATILPTTLPADDLFSENRPLLACSSETKMAFFSLRNNKCVKEMHCEKQILQIDANEKIIITVTSHEIYLMCPNRLLVICKLTNCMGTTEPYDYVPHSLSENWLAFADSQLSRNIQSTGGDISEPGSVPYAVTLLTVKKMVKSSLGSRDSVNDLSADDQELGIVTIVDLNRLIDFVSTAESIECDTNLHNHVVVAHFIAHLWTPVAKMVFDTTGTLLLTTCNQGLFCHLFRIAPHPTRSKQAAVLHLYRLKRGDTPCNIISMAISKDSRLASASSNHGTIHVWPISSYGGSVCVRTHCQKHVVNRLSRLERSAGLQEHQVTRPHVSSLGLLHDGLPNHAYHSLCPRLPPMPIPCSINSYVQLKPISHIPPSDRPLVLVSYYPVNEYTLSEDQYERSEPILVFSIDGRLIQYNLRHHPDAQYQKSSRIELDAPFVIEKKSMFQWKLMLGDVSNCIDKSIISRHQSEPKLLNNKVIFKSNSHSAMLCSIIPDFLNPSFSNNKSTPKCWYSNIEISSQISSTSNIRRQDKFSISTYQTKDLCEARLQVITKSPSISSDMSTHSIQSESDKIDFSKTYFSSNPVKVPYSEHRIQICNSFCGSSVSDSLGGSVDNVCSILAHAALDEDEYLEPSSDTTEYSKSSYIEIMTRDMGQARLRRVSGSCLSDNGRIVGLSSSPLEADIIEELDVVPSQTIRQSKLSKSQDKGRRN